jgi:hypothetical protein
MNHNEPGVAIDSKLRRRGLLTGLAALGAAAMFKLTGTRGAEATNVGDPLTYGTSATGTGTTRINGDISTTGAFVANNYSSNIGVSTGDAIQARSNKANSISAGIRGIGHPDSSAGVMAGVIGEYYGGQGVGVLGHTFGGPQIIPVGARNVGVFGMSHSSFTAIKGEATNGYGVWGTSSGAAGVLGTSASGYAVQGASNANGTGGIFSSVHGLGLSATSTNFVGLVGIAPNHIGVYANSSSPAWPALFVENVGGGPAATFYGSVVVNGNFSVVGAKNALVPLPDGSLGTMYCQESPEPFFEDFGRAQLVGGTAHVNLEPLFASLIKREDYMVFLTPGANSNGLYVSHQDATGFDVVEQNGGKSSITFAYRVVSRRKDIRGQRLARIDSSVARSTVKVTTPPPPNLPASAYGPTFADPGLNAPLRYAPNGDILPASVTPPPIPQPGATQPMPQPQPGGTQPGPAPQPSPTGQTRGPVPPPNAPSGPPSIAGN